MFNNRRQDLKKRKNGAIIALYTVRRLFESGIFGKRKERSVRMKLEYFFPSARGGENDSRLCVENGRVLGILAPTGCGKTSLMKSLCGFAVSDLGRGFLDGEPITDKNRSRISFVPDLDFYDVGERVGKIVRLFSSLFIDFDFSDACDALEYYGISTADSISSLPEADRQIFRLILGSCRRADFYVFDEPLRNFDTERRNEILKKIFAERKHAGFVVSTSRPYGVSALFDDVCFIFDGSPRLVSAVSSLTKTFGKKLSRIYSEVYECS